MLLFLSMGINHTTVRKIMRKNPNLKPYRLLVHQQLTPLDEERRIAFSNWLKEKVCENQGFLQQVWFTDGTHFHLNGKANRQNWRI